jgi:integrase
LNPQAVRDAASKGLYPDGDGLYLLVGRGGTKSWIYRYRQNGRLRDMGLGPLRHVSLREARQKALAAARLRLDGGDPITENRTKKQRAELDRAKAVTFQECAAAYIAAHRAGWKNPKHAAQWPSTLAAYVYPIFGGLPVAAIDTALVIKVLEQPVKGAAPGDENRLWWRKTETASRVRQRIEAVLDWAKHRGHRDGENPARWDGHLEISLPKKTEVRAVKHHAALPYDELPAFMAALRGRNEIAALALQFTILTAMRTDAVRLADIAEIKDRVWTVPAARMKGEQKKEKPKDFRLPLPVAALAIVEQLPRGHGAGWLFPGAKRGRPLSNMAMLELLRRMGRGGELTVHGFRSTFEDWAHDTTTSPHEVIEMALGHAIGSKVEAAYRRGELFEKRRQLMEAWGRYCGTPPAPGEVVSLGRTAAQ